MADSTLVLGVAAAVLCVVLALLYQAFSATGQKADEAQSSTASEQEKKKKGKRNQPKVDITANIKKKSSKKKAQHKVEFKHELLEITLKGHQDLVDQLAVDPSGRFLASTSRDRTIRVWNLDTIKDGNVMYARTNINLDHASAVGWSSDSKYVVAGFSESKQVKVYGVAHKGKKVTTKELTAFDTPHEQPMVSVNMVPHQPRPQIITCGSASDTSLNVFEPTGQHLFNFRTNQLQNYMAVASLTGRFLATATRMSDVKIWEQVVDKAGRTMGVAMSLKGHKRGVRCVSFSQGVACCCVLGSMREGACVVCGLVRWLTVMCMKDEKTVLTGSSDGTWRLWDIAVRYNVNEEPHMLKSVECKHGEVTACAIRPAPEQKKRDLSKMVVAIGNGSTVQLATGDGKVLHDIPGAHDKGVTCLAFSSDGKRLFSVGGKLIRVWDVSSV